MNNDDVDRVQAIAEAVADVLAERGLVVYAGPNVSARILKVVEVAHLLGRSPTWVYEHAAELGAIRMGKGPKARIGFDPSTIEQWKRNHQIAPPARRQPARLRPRQSSAPNGINLIPYEPLRHRA